MVRQLQQFVDLIVAHVERAAIADEAQPFGMLRPVHPEVPRRALWRGQQAFLLVVADRLNRALKRPGFRKPPKVLPQIALAGNETRSKPLVLRAPSIVGAW